MRAVDKDQSVMIRCSAAGTPTPTIQWLKDFFPLPSQDERFRIQPNGKKRFFWVFNYLPLIIMKWLNINVIHKYRTLLRYSEFFTANVVMWSVFELRKRLRVTSVGYSRQTEMAWNIFNFIFHYVEDWVFVCVYVCICVYVYVCMYVCLGLNVCMYAFLYICLCAYVYMYVSLCFSMCMFVCMWTIYIAPFEHLSKVLHCTLYSKLFLS